MMARKRRSHRLGAAITADQMPIPASAPVAVSAPRKPLSGGAKVAIGVGVLGALGGLGWLIWSRVTYKDSSVKEGAALEAMRPPDNSPPGTKEEKLIQSLEPQLQPKVRAFLQAARAAGHKIILTQGRRTIAEQDALYAQGRTAPGKKVTNAKGGSSAHNYGMAFDFAFLDANGRASWSPKEPWAAVGKIGVAQGLEWGGSWKSFKDMPHFELPGWKAMRAAWQAGKLQVA